MHYTKYCDTRSVLVVPDYTFPSIGLFVIKHCVVQSLTTNSCVWVCTEALETVFIDFIRD